MLWCSRRGRKWLRVMVSQRMDERARGGGLRLSVMASWADGELGYGSDLDLIFLHDCPMDVMTNGEREIDGRQFYLRRSALSSVQYAHLPPAFCMRWMRVYAWRGRVLVTSADAFADYQQHEARTWNIRRWYARVVYGDRSLHSQFDAVRRTIMTTARDGRTLQTEVREMREKMRAHLGNKHRDRFDIKADEGGITDIEFIAQYLRHCATLMKNLN